MIALLSVNTGRKYTSGKVILHLNEPLAEEASGKLKNLKKMKYASDLLLLLTLIHY